MKGGEGKEKGNPFIFCALPIFRAAKTRSLADLHRFLGFPFPKNAQERLLRRLVKTQFGD